jgi:hypothetical protein
MKNGVAIYGGFGASGDPDMADRDPNMYETILSGDLLGNDNPDTPAEDLRDNPNRTDNCYHIFYHPEGLALDPNAILDGFTITAGNSDEPYPSPHANGSGMYNRWNSSPTVTNCTFGSNSAENGGAGMYNSFYSSPTLTRCTFTDNSAGLGGGMLNYYHSSPTVANCTFTRNSARDTGGGITSYSYSNLTVTNCTFTINSAYWGGGMHNYASNPTVTDCSFTGNSANSSGGMDNRESSPTVISCTFSVNSAEWGGAMYNRESSPTMTGCTFTGNTANRDGGGMYNRGSSPTMTGCNFTGNMANEDGGGMYNRGSSPTITNCTFTGNSALRGGGMYNTVTSNPKVTNCILWDNAASSEGNEIALRDSSTIDVAYCDVQGGQAGIYDDLSGNTINWGTGNIDADPSFVDPNGPDGVMGTEDDNLRLSPESPCIDVGDNSVVDANYPDLDGNERIVNGIVDMGAYEALGPVEADVHIVPRVINRNNRMKRVMAVMRLPGGIGKGDVVRESFELYANGLDGEPVGAILERVIGRGNMTRVFVLFDKEEVMSVVEGVGRVELTVVGRLESGQYIQGSDTVRIVKPRRRRLRWRGRH